jgi:hypothetical protein
MQHVQLLPQRRGGLGACGRRDQVQVAAREEHYVQRACRYGAHAVALVAYDRHHRLDDGEEA